MSDAIKDDSQLEIVFPSKSTATDGVKISEEDDRVPLISSATVNYKTKGGAVHILSTNYVVEVMCYVQFLHQVRRRVRGFLLLEEFETGRSAGYTILNEHGDDLIQFVINENELSTIVIAIKLLPCSTKTARENYQNIAAKFRELDLDKFTPLEPVESTSPFVRFRCLISCQDLDLSWHHHEAKSEAILLKLPPLPRLVGIQPKVVRLSGECALIMVRLDRSLIDGYDSVTGAFLKLPGNPDQRAILMVSRLQDDRNQDIVRLNIAQCFLSDDAKPAMAAIILRGSSGGVDWCVEADGVSVLPASLPPTKLERRDRVMSVADWMDEVDCATLIGDAQN